MKTLFFIAALAGAVYLIMQTPAGKVWLQNSEPELKIQQETQRGTQQEQQVSTEVLQSLETKVTEFSKRLNQTQQAQINQLENRIAELENELVMGRIAEIQQQQSVSNSKLTQHPYKQPAEPFLALPSKPGFDINTQTPDRLLATSDDQLQRNRQAMLQDIAQKMEMSSLQALVN